MILDTVRMNDASTNTKFHVLYGFFLLGLVEDQAGSHYCESDTTIGDWIKQYEESGNLDRKKTIVYHKYDDAKRKWLIEWYDKNPLGFLDEAQTAFMIQYNTVISITSIWNIIHEGGLTRKQLERRDSEVI